MPGFDFISAIIGGVASLVGNEAIQYYRRPRISLEIYRKEHEPLVVTRTLDTGPIEVSGQGAVRRELVKDIHLLVTNEGLRPVQGCEATLVVYDEGEPLPEPIRLGWRKRPPKLYNDIDQLEAMRQRTAPFAINRKSSEQLDLLRLHYSGIKDRETNQVLDTTVEELTTLSAFPRHGFQSDKKYELEVMVSSSNANPETISLELNWDGSLNMKNAISVI